VVCGEDAAVCNVTVHETHASKQAVDCPAIFVGQSCVKYTIALARDKIDKNFGRDARVYYRVAEGGGGDNAAKADEDFESKSTHVDFKRPNRESGTIDFIVVDDNTPEPAEHFIIELSSRDFVKREPASPAGGVAISADIQTLLVTIAASDYPGGLFKFGGEATREVVEGDPGDPQSTVSLALQRTKAQGDKTPASFTVVYATVYTKDDATPVVALKETVFAPGKGDKLLDAINIEQDFDPELNEATRVVLCGIKKPDATISQQATSCKPEDAADPCACATDFVGDFGELVSICSGGASCPVSDNTRVIKTLPSDNALGIFSVDTMTPRVVVGAHGNGRSLTLIVSREGGKSAAVPVQLEIRSPGVPAAAPIGECTKPANPEGSFTESKERVYLSVGRLDSSDADKWGCRQSVTIAAGESATTVVVLLDEGNAAAPLRLKQTDATTANSAKDSSIAATIQADASLNAAAGSKTAWEENSAGTEVWQLTKTPVINAAESSIDVQVGNEATDGTLEFRERKVQVSEPASNRTVLTLTIERKDGSYLPKDSLLRVPYGLVLERDGKDGLCPQSAVGRLTSCAQSPIYVYIDESGSADVVLELNADDVAEEEAEERVVLLNEAGGSSLPQYCPNPDAGPSTRDCRSSGVAINADGKEVVVTVAESDSPRGVIHFAQQKTSQRNVKLAQSSSQISHVLLDGVPAQLVVVRQSGRKGPFGAASVKYQIFDEGSVQASAAGGDLVPIQEKVLTFEDAGDDVDMDGQAQTKYIELNLGPGTYQVVLSDAKTAALGPRAFVTATFPKPQASSSSSSGVDRCNANFTMHYDACYGITKDAVSQASRSGYPFEPSHIGRCVSTLLRLELFQVTYCRDHVAFMEGAIRGVIEFARVPATARAAAGYASIGRPENVLEILEGVAHQKYVSSVFQSIISEFAYSLYSECVGSCACAKSVKTSQGFISVTASRVDTKDAYLDMRHAGSELPAFAFPQVASVPDGSVLAGECQERYFVTNKVTQYMYTVEDEYEYASGTVMAAGLNTSNFADIINAVGPGAAVPKEATELNFTVDVGDEDNTAECVAWDAGADAWSSNGCRLDSRKDNKAFCSCSKVAGSYAVLTLKSNILPTYVMAACVIVVVAAVILMGASIFMPALHKYNSGTMLLHVAISVFASNLMFVISAVATENAAETDQFILGMLLHYASMANALALCLAMLHIMFSLSSMPTLFLKYSKVAIWVVPFALVVFTILFAYDEAASDVYGDVYGNDQLSLIPSTATFVGAFLLEFVVKLIVAVMAFIGIVVNGTYEVDVEQKGKPEILPGTEKITAALLLWSFVPPLIAFIAVNTLNETMGYILAVASVIQGIVILLFCLDMAMRREGMELISKDIELQATGPSKESADMLVNTTSPASPAASAYGASAMAVPLPGAMPDSSPLQFSAPNASMYSDAGSPPAYDMNAVDTAEFDNLIFRLKPDAPPTSAAAAAVPRNNPYTSAGTSKRDEQTNEGITRLSIADTHL